MNKNIQWFKMSIIFKWILEELTRYNSNFIKLNFLQTIKANSAYCSVKIQQIFKRVLTFVCQYKDFSNGHGKSKDRATKGFGKMFLFISEYNK